MEKTRVVIVCNQMLPYRIPVFDELSALPDLDVHVIYLSQKEKNRQWNVPEPKRHAFSILPGLSGYVAKRDWPVHINWGLNHELNRLQPRVVVTMGYDSPAFWLAYAWAERHDAAKLLYMGSTRFSSRTQSGPIDWLRRMYVRRTDAFLAYGSWGRDYLLHMGAKWDSIFIGLNTVDVEDVARRVDEATLRGRRTKPGRHDLLYVGQLIPRKGVRHLLQALERIQHPKWHLHIAGSGPDEAELRKYTHVHDLAQAVTFHGHQNSQQLSELMARCEILVMPSLSEVWGLVVNEALAAGLFVLAGQQAGAVPDLLQHGVNGFAIDPVDTQHFAKSLEWAMNHPKDRRLIRSTVMHCTPRHTAEQLAEAVRYAGSRGQSVEVGELVG